MRPPRKRFRLIMRAKWDHRSLRQSVRWRLAALLLPASLSSSLKSDKPSSSSTSLCEFASLNESPSLASRPLTLVCCFCFTGTARAVSLTSTLALSAVVATETAAAAAAGLDGGGAAEEPLPGVVELEADDDVEAETLAPIDCVACCIVISIAFRLKSSLLCLKTSVFVRTGAVERVRSHTCH